MFSRPAIGTVATEARVSIKTVSRVINNSSRVKAATRDHVMDVIRRLGYSPSPNARRLAGHRSFVIGLPFDNPFASFVTDVQSSSRALFRSANYQVVMHACDSQSPSLADDIRLFVHSVRVDGVILTPPLSDSDAVAHALAEDGVAFVRIAPTSRDDAARSVVTDEHNSCLAMTRRLAALGHRRIAFINEGGMPSARYLGYRDGLDSASLPLEEGLIVDCDASFASAIAAAERLLRKRTTTRPTAIFASTDQAAAGALHVAHARGIEVPSQLSIAGFGDEPIATQVWPTLSTIRQPVRPLAQQAAQLLLCQLRGDDAPRDIVQLEPRLILRRSTARVAAA